MRDKEKIKLLRGELYILLACCKEALSDEWDRGDEGFISMKEAIEDVLQKTKKKETPLETYEALPLGYKLSYSFKEWKEQMGIE